MVVNKIKKFCSWYNRETDSYYPVHTYLKQRNSENQKKYVITESIKGSEGKTTKNWK